VAATLAGPPVGAAVTVPRITLLARPGCHLCDDARQVISKVADDLGVAWEERDITQSEADLREYWEKIPVTLVDGVQHDFWRVSENRLRQALKLGPASSTQPRRHGAYFVHLFTNDVW
jgi:glutaredoxin